MYPTEQMLYHLENRIRVVTLPPRNIRELKEQAVKRQLHVP